MSRPVDSRVEKILRYIIDGRTYEDPTLSRVEELLLELQGLIGSNSGDGNSNYGIVASSDLLPNDLEVSDRKLYYSIADGFFWLWDGTKWAEQQPKSITDEFIDSLFD